MGKNNRISVIALIACLLVFPAIIRSPYYISVLVFVGIYSMITIGLSLLMGYAGQISLGHAAYFAIGAYTSAILTTRYGLSPWLAFLSGLVLAAVIAFLIGLPSLKLKGHYLAMATLGFGEIVYVFLNAAVDLTNGPVGMGEIPQLNLFGFLLDSEIKYYYFTWAIAVSLLILSLNIIHSRVGRALRSIHGDEVAANAMGVNTAKYKVQVFVLSAIFAAIAGSLYAHFVTFVSPTSFDLIVSILLVTMVVIGGMANVWGAILGAALLTIMPEGLRAFKDFDILIYGTILVLIMIFMPKGLLAGLADFMKGLSRPKSASVG